MADFLHSQCLHPPPIPFLGPPLPPSLENIDISDQQILRLARAAVGGSAAVSGTGAGSAGVGSGSGGMRAGMAAGGGGEEPSIDTQALCLVQRTLQERNK